MIRAFIFATYLGWGKNNKGGIAQLARVLAWHARGHRFESVYLHN